MSKKNNDSITPVQEDYLEAIYEIIVIDNSVAAKVTDIADRLEVNKSNVSNMMKVLKKKNYINYSTYSWITLTKKGNAKAEQIYKRHKNLIVFFHEILGLDENNSAENACRIEHAIDCKAMDRLNKFCRFIKKIDKLKYNKHKEKFVCPEM